MASTALRTIVAGDPAPDFELPSLAGGSVRLSGLSRQEGRPVHVGVLVRMPGAAARLAAVQ